MLKKLTALALALLMLFACVSSLAYTSNPDGVITGGSAAVFQNNPPLLGEQPSAYIPGGASVVVTSSSGSYRYVMYFSGGGVVQGWVDRAQVRIIDPVPTYIPPAPTARPTAKPTARPTARPTSRPTARPTSRPTSRPTKRPERTASPTSAPQAAYGEAVVLCEALSMRDNPYATARKVTTIKNGATVYILDEIDGWYNVEYKASSKKVYTGWVDGAFVQNDPWYVRTTDLTSAYATPNLSGKKVGQVPAGTRLLVIDETEDFYVVNLRSASAYVFKGDIQ